MIRAFDTANVGVAAIVGFAPFVAFNGLGAGLLGMLGAAVGAAIAGFFCRRWPGLAAPWWKLWLAAWLFNPVNILAVAYILFEYQCLFGQSRGWQCMGLALVILGSPLTLVAPTVAVIAHAIARRSRPVAG